eukprot:150462_1
MYIHATRSRKMNNSEFEQPGHAVGISDPSYQAYQSNCKMLPPTLTESHIQTSRGHTKYGNILPTQLNPPMAPIECLTHEYRDHKSTKYWNKYTESDNTDSDPDFCVDQDSVTPSPDEHLIKIEKTNKQCPKPTDVQLPVENSGLSMGSTAHARNKKVNIDSQPFVYESKAETICQAPPERVRVGNT